MRAIAAGLFAIAIAILILAGVILASVRPAQCTIGGGAGLPAVTVNCADIPRQSSAFTTR